VLIEAMTYRVGHHSTSDDYTRYRANTEVNVWTSQGKNPINRSLLPFITPFWYLCDADFISSRLFFHLKSKGWITDEERARMSDECKKVVMSALKSAEGTKKPHLDHTFTDVYDQLPKHLQQQQKELHEHLQKYGKFYNLNEYSDKL